MAARLIGNNQLVSANGTPYQSTPVTLFRSGTGHVIFVEVALSGAKSGTNNLKLTWDGIPNPQDSDASKKFIEETDTSIWPVTIIDQDQADSTFTDMFHIPGTYGVGRLVGTRSGTGSNTFDLTWWISP